MNSEEYSDAHLGISRLRDESASLQREERDV